jgi:hypothetical protein
MTIKENPVEQITVNKVENGWIYYNSGVTPILAIIEI